MYVYVIVLEDNTYKQYGKVVSTVLALDVFYSQLFLNQIIQSVTYDKKLYCFKKCNKNVDIDPLMDY